MAHDLLETAIRMGRAGATERLVDRPPERDRVAASPAAGGSIRAGDGGMTTGGISFGGPFNVGGGVISEY